jgi:soluble lytic murein transglycosylase-like protein
MSRVVRTAAACALAVTLSAGTGNAGAQGYEEAIVDACARYGCDAGQVIRVMYCESGGDPYAVNPVTGDYGLMQINLGIWGPITDPFAQIEFAAEKFASGQGDLWVCR